MAGIIFPPIVAPLSAVLGLLITWRRHQTRLAAGIIRAKDLFARSDVQFYLYVTPDDRELCASCRQAHGNAYLARTIEQEGCPTFASPCPSPETCQGIFIPFYARWLEANELVARLRASQPTASVRMTREQLVKLASVVRHLPAGDPDRPGLHLLSAFMQEHHNPEQAIRSYGAVLDQATDLHRALLISAYMRLSGLLARQGDPRKALQVITHFEKRYASGQEGAFRPTGKQRRALSIMKTYLYALIDSSAQVIPKPATIPSAPIQEHHQDLSHDEQAGGDRS